MKLPPDVHAYLTNRGIAAKVILRNEVSWQSGTGWNGRRIAIPVKDEQGVFLFNKYRRHPHSKSGPKYTYDQGASAALYHYDMVGEKHGNADLIITEGELDTLVLETKGFRSVSSTGGCGTFLNEWKKMLHDESILVCYDNDEAGVRGTAHTLLVLREGFYIRLPKEEGVKDVTDYFLRHTKEDFDILIERSEKFVVPDITGKPESRKERDLLIGEIESFADEMLYRKRSADNTGGDSRIYDVFIEMAQRRCESLEFLFSTQGRARGNGEDVQVAKAFPIPKLIEFTNHGFAKCIFHNEDTGSMKYYREKNNVYCFGCARSADAIDIVMELEHLPFREAVGRLNSYG